MAIVIPARGEFIHVVKLENPVKPADGAGGRIDDFEPFCTTRACFQKESGSREFVEGYDQLVSVHRCFLFWRSEFENNIRKDTRFIYDNQVYKMIRKDLVDKKRSMYMFTLIDVE